MKKISAKLSMVIIACSFAAILLLGGIGTVKAYQIVQDDAESTLLEMSRRYAAQFSNDLNMIENNVQEMEVYFRDTFDLQALKTNPNYLAEYEEQLAEYIFGFAGKRAKGIAAWCYFNPTLSETPHDVYFVDGNGDNIPDRQNYIPFSYYDGIPTPTDDKQWWYGPVQTKAGFWTNPYEWELKNGEIIKVVSYAQPIYYGNNLIAVIGTYYHFDDMYKEISEIEVYKSGYATLLNEKLDFIIHPEFQSGTRYTSDNLATIQDGKYADISKEVLKQEHGIVSFDGSQGEEILAYGKLSNGWTLGIIPNQKEMMANFYTLAYQLLIAMLFCMALSVVAAYLVSLNITKSLRAVIRGANQISTGDLNVFIEVDSQDEIKTVADSLNTMIGNTKQLQEELRQLAYYDELTGISNKNLFKIAAENLIQQGHTQYAYVILDVNKFKVINDILGYVYGDLLLKYIANILCEEFCSDETAARYSGDVFHILCKFGSRNALEERLEALAARIADFAFIHTVDCHISVCFGVYVIENLDSKIESMGDKAGFALKKVKENYSNAVYFFNDTIRNLIIEEQEIETDMQLAMENQEFKVYLQPKFALATEQIESAEALVRWVHPKKGFMPPDRFIPVFEKNGFVTKMDFYVLDQVCQHLRAWMDMGREPMVISVNQSRLHLHNPNYLFEIMKVLGRHEISPKWIELEITESAFFEDTAKMIEILNSLHELEFKISMDDFGSGYSSLNMLQDIAVDVLKIDKKFFNDSSNSERGKKIVDNIISMASDLNIIVVAEGVETKEQVEFLKETNCHLVQGYYYARPMPMEEFESRFFGEQDAGGEHIIKSLC